MWPPSLPLLRRAALAISLFSLTNPDAARADMNPGSIEWSLSAPPLEADPKSFPAVAIHLRNQTTSAQTLRLHFDLGPLRSLGGPDLEVALEASEEKTVLYTLHVPPEAPGGSDIPLRARANDGTERGTSIRIKAVPDCKATAESVDTRFVRPGEKAAYKVKIVNTGNIPLHCALRPTTSPQATSTTVATENLVVPVGGSAEAAVEVATGGEMTDFTPFVTSVEINTAELSGDAARQFLYFHTEAFPQPAPPDHTHLFETLKGSVFVGVGAGSGNQQGQSGADGLVGEALTLEGLIAEKTQLQLIQAFTYPNGNNGYQSSALSSLQSGQGPNFFHLGVYNPYFDFEAGEITIGSDRLLTPHETAAGFRVAVRPVGSARLQIEAFGGENRLTLNHNDVFGATVSGAVLNSPLEFWRVGILGKRGDIGPQGSDWNAAGVDTGWKIPLTIPLRTELAVAGGQNSEGQNGVAWLAGLHYNRVFPGEPDTSPLKMGVEIASGGNGFPGAQNGLDDQVAYLSYRFSSSPTYLEAYANYNNYNYQVVPDIQKTVQEEQGIVPDFLLTSESRLLNAGVRWNTLVAAPGAWHLPSGNAQFEEASFFNKSNFFDKTDEKAVAINLQPFVQPSASGTQWFLNLLVRGGTETDEANATPNRTSQFLTFGTDFNFSRPAPGFLNQIGGPGHLSAEFSGRYTVNLDGDTQALNRTGVSATAAASWQTETWSVRAGTTLYSYAGEGISDRVWASINRKVAKRWWAGIEAAYTHRGSGTSSGGLPDESAVLFTFRHDFEIPVPWLPRRGQVAGRVFNDVNNNGRQDPSEPGLEGVKVAVGKSQALSGPDGEFSFPPMTDGAYPVEVTPPTEVHFNQSSDHPTEKTLLTKGAITQLAIGLTKPTTCEGKVRFVRENSEADVATTDRPEDLSGLEIICTDSAGRVQRGATRADGFFAIYLDPGTYEIKINSETLKPQQSVSPEKLTVKVERTRIENLAFTVTERSKRIRKTFTATNP